MTSLGAVRARFARNEGLPFADLLTEASIRDVLNEHGVHYRDRLFSPVTTTWGFLSQVLSDGHGCRDAVSRVNAHRAASGGRACSPNAASYCNARARLVTGVPRTLAMRAARELQASAAEGWRWHGRSEFIADGSHVSMPDTQENQAGYPQPPQQPGVGFSLARLAVLPSLATWPSRRTPARPPSCGRCTAPSSPATWCSPTPCSTTASSPSSCASAASSWSPRCRRSA